MYGAIACTCTPPQAMSSADIPATLSLAKILLTGTEVGRNLSPSVSPCSGVRGPLPHDNRLCMGRDPQAVEDLSLAKKLPHARLCVALVILQLPLFPSLCALPIALTVSMYQAFGL